MKLYEEKPNTFIPTQKKKKMRITECKNNERILLEELPNSGFNLRKYNCKTIIHRTGKALNHIGGNFLPSFLQYLLQIFEEICRIWTQSSSKCHMYRQGIFGVVILLQDKVLFSCLSCETQSTAPQTNSTMVCSFTQAGCFLGYFRT